MELFSASFKFIVMVLAFSSFMISEHHNEFWCNIVVRQLPSIATLLSCSGNLVVSVLHFGSLVVSVLISWWCHTTVVGMLECWKGSYEGMEVVQFSFILNGVYMVRKEWLDFWYCQLKLTWNMGCLDSRYGDRDAVCSYTWFAVHWG